jgi:hypothetical protein
MGSAFAARSSALSCSRKWTTGYGGAQWGEVLQAATSVVVPLML